MHYGVRRSVLSMSGLDGFLNIIRGLAHYYFAVSVYFVEQTSVCILCYNSSVCAPCSMWASDQLENTEY